MQQRALIFILILAIVARLAFLLILNNVFFFERSGNIHGSTAYDEYALNLLATGVYGRELGVPDASIAPLYSYLVAAIYATIGRGGLQIGLVHIALDLITISCVYDIVRRLFKNDWTALLAALFTALYPYLVFQNLSLNDTAFFMAQMHLFLWLLLRLWEEEKFSRRAIIWALLAGIVLGLSTLTRALLPVFALLAAFWFLWRHGFWESLKRLCIVAFVSILVLVPWMLRSYQIYGRFVAVAMNTGENLWQGSNPMTIALFEAGYDAQWSVPPEEARGWDEARRQDYLNAQAWQFLRENPELVPRLLWVKFLVYWSINISPHENPQDNQNFALDAAGNLLIVDSPNATLQDIQTIATYESDLYNRVARPVHILYFGTLLFLAIPGLLLSLKQWRSLSILWFLQLSMMLVYIFFHPSTRYRAPSDPLLFAFSAYTLLWLWQRIKTWQNPPKS